MPPQLLWVCGGVLNAMAVAASRDFHDLYAASIETVGIVCRLCHEGFERATALEDDIGVGRTWGWSVAGIDTMTMRTALAEFHRENVSISDAEPHCQCGLHRHQKAVVCFSGADLKRLLLCRIFRATGKFK